MHGNWLVYELFEEETKNKRQTSLSRKAQTIQGLTALLGSLIDHDFPMSK